MFIKEKKKGEVVTGCSRRSNKLSDKYGPDTGLI